MTNFWEKTLKLQGSWHLDTIPTGFCKHLWLQQNRELRLYWKSWQIKERTLTYVIAALMWFLADLSQHLRPILLIGHSFGGIVIEHVCRCLYLVNCSNIYQAINEAEKEYKNIFEAICGIIFLGTPFQGSDFATPARLLVHISAPFGSKTILLRLLQSHSQELANLREDFIRSISRMKPFRSRETVWEVDESPFIYTFFEDIDTVLLGLISVGKVGGLFSPRSCLLTNNRLWTVILRVLI